jgi:glycosidase
VHDALGGDATLARLRDRLRRRGLRLMLDFVPNHTALDHPWVENHPEYYCHLRRTAARQGVWFWQAGSIR